MTHPALRDSRAPHELLVWVLGFILVALIGGSLTMDLTGVTPADEFVVGSWGFTGLRIYLWLEAAVLAGVVATLGAHVITSGFALTRGSSPRMFGLHLRLHPGLPRQLGYVFVVLGSALVSLSLTTLVLLNSCRYMRLI